MSVHGIVVPDACDGQGRVGGDAGPGIGWVDDGSVGDWLGGEEPPEPQWALQASEEVLREWLAAAAVLPAGGDTALVVEALTPDGTAGEALAGTAGVDAAGLVQGVVATQRLINHYQAVQQRWLAALARPGVAVPLDQLVDACQHPAGRVPGALRPPSSLPGDLPRGADGELDLRPLLAHPAWQPALADTAARLASAEVGCALHIAPITARIRTEKAVTMIDALPATHAAQHAGDIDAYRASLIAEGTAVLDPDQRQVVERRVLPGASSRTPGVLRDRVDRAVIGIDPDASRRRVERARAGRGVRLDRDVDDMAVFRALLHCADAQLAYGVLDEQAAALTAAGLAGGRGTAQLRADVFCDLFATLATTGHAHLTTRPGAHSAANSAADDGAGTRVADVAGGGGPVFSGVAPCHGPDDGHHRGHGRQGSGPAGTVAGFRRRAALNVYLDAATLAGLDDRPGELAGYGTVTAQTARALAASADTIRALIIRPVGHRQTATALGGPPAPGLLRGAHSPNTVRSRVCGTVLDAGRSVYRPPDAVLDYVTARDRTCTWPGCRAPGTRCDADHRRPYRDGGATCPCNLDLLCRFHHQIRTFTPGAHTPDPTEY